MTHQEIIDMARAEGLTFVPDANSPLVRIVQKAVQLEREACALVCEDVSLQAATSWKLAYQPQDQGREIGADDCAVAIRARGAA
jgi:hypothetical protein